MQEIKLLDNMKIVTGPLAIGDDWPGVFLSAKYLHDTFDYLIKDISEEDKKQWFAKEKEKEEILERASKEPIYEKRTLIIDEYSKVRKEVEDLLKFNIKDIYIFDENNVELNRENAIKYEIKNQLARTVEHKHTGTIETTFKVQKIESFITDDKNFRVDSGILKINDQYGYFLRGDHTFYITGDSSTINNFSDKNLINYCNILLGCIVI